MLMEPKKMKIDLKKEQTYVRHLEENISAKTSCIPKPRFSILTRWFGTLASGIAMYFVGRKKILVLSNILSLLTSTLIACDFGYRTEAYVLLLAKFTVDFSRAVSFVYGVEVCAPWTRAFMLGLEEPAVWWTHMFILPVHRQNPVKNVVHVGITICSTVLAVAAPETPVWLVMAGRREEAEEAFNYLRAGDERDAEEFRAMCDAAEMEAERKRRGLLEIIFSRTFLIPLLVVIFIRVGQNSLVVFHGYQLSKVEIEDSLYYWFEEPVPPWFLARSEFYSLLGQTISSSTYVGLTFVCPRRILFFAIKTVSFIFWGIMLLVDFEVSYMDVIMQYSVPLPPFLRSLGEDEIALLIGAEIFPSAARDIGMAFSVFFYRLWHVMDQSWFTYFVGEWYKFKGFYIRCFMYPIGLVFSYLFMPETKDLTLEEAVEMTRSVSILNYDNDALNEETEEDFE